MCTPPLRFGDQALERDFWPEHWAGGPSEVRRSSESVPTGAVSSIPRVHDAKSVGEGRAIPYRLRWGLFMI